MELAAYRTVQHAMVAVRDADGEPATIALRYTPRALELEVHGFPTGGPSADAALMAARERVTAHGGTFAAEGAALGRRVLRAQLPIPAAHG